MVNAGDRLHQLRTQILGNGEEAIDVLLMGKFDAILMDIDMPVMDGMSATRHIREGQGGEHNTRIPIVATTAFASTSDQGKFLEAGMDYFLSKPLSAEMLRQTLLTIAKKTSSPSPP
ncbi:MAG: response regulator [Spirulinaceae cyanobacterium RM2_2_10]|nr:response regulator [Spirulinaceae cyanobacterium RM2_2_10]